MFLDASALVAILTREPGHEDLLERLQVAEVRMTSPLAVWETTKAVSRRLGLPVETASNGVFNYLELANISLTTLPAETTRIAVEAFDRYGKGRHPARLNFGDCFAYACSRHFKVPLLFKGEEFSQTDVAKA